MSGDKMGGPAFPVNTAQINNPGACFSNEGMTLWDYYVAHCGDLDENYTADRIAQAFGLVVPDGGAGKNLREWLLFYVEANAAYKAMQADAMLAERAKREKPNE